MGKIRWTYEMCRAEAEKYSTKHDFRYQSPRAYDAAIRNKWISKFEWLEGKKGNGYFTRKKCVEEALCYSSMIEFRNGSNSAYQAAKRNKWLSDYTWFEKRRISDKNIYLVYCYKDDETNSVYVGLTCDLTTRHRQHTTGTFFSGHTYYSTVYKYFRSIGKEVPEPIILRDCLFAKEAQEYEETYVRKFKESGMNVLNVAKTGSLGSLGNLTKEKCFNLAKKYKTRAELKKKYQYLYKLSCENGWLDEYTWMAPSSSKKKWDEVTCYNEAKKYKTKTEFAKNCGGAYNVSYKNGWLKTYTWMPQGDGRFTKK